jgi:hypothetical protein
MARRQPENPRLEDDTDLGERRLRSLGRPL